MKLLNARESRRLTQAELARQAEVDLSTVRRAEAGHRVRRMHALEIAHVLRMSVREIDEFAALFSPEEEV